MRDLCPRETHVGGLPTALRGHCRVCGGPASVALSTQFWNCAFFYKRFRVTKSTKIPAARIILGLARVFPLAAHSRPRKSSNLPDRGSPAPAPRNGTRPVNGVPRPSPTIRAVDESTVGARAGRSWCGSASGGASNLESRAGIEDGDVRRQFFVPEQAAISSVVQRHARSHRHLVTPASSGMQADLAGVVGNDARDVP